MRAEEMLASSARGEVALDGLLLAERAGRTVGAGLIVFQRDGAAFVWPPVARDGFADEVADAILGEMRLRLDASGAWIGQCLLEPGQTDDRAALVRSGFPYLTDLVFMQRSLADVQFPASTSDLEAVVFDPADNAPEFAAMLERTYHGTRDCPELDGVRSGSEALASHRTAGAFDPSRWWLFRSGGENVGVLLMTDHPEQQAWEVVYLGIVPEARGRGLGRTVLTYGLQAAQSAGRASVMLAVDVRNSYARKIYEQAGFVEITVCAVHARVRERRRCK